MGAEVRQFEFGPFRIKSAGRSPMRDTEVVGLKPKVFDTLLLLVEGAGRVLSKDQPMQAHWPDAAVEREQPDADGDRLRKVLGERPGEHCHIATVPGRGYSFAADVRALGTTGMTCWSESSAALES